MNTANNPEFDRNQLEDASADLEVVGTFLDCCEGLTHEIRILYEATGNKIADRREFLNLDVMLMESLAKTREAKGKIDSAVDAYIAARKSAQDEAA